MVSTLSQHGSASGAPAGIGYCRWALLTKVPDYILVPGHGCVWCAWERAWVAEMREEVKRAGRGTSVSTHVMSSLLISSL